MKKLFAALFASAVLAGCVAAPVYPPGTVVQPAPVYYYPAPYYYGPSMYFRFGGGRRGWHHTDPSWDDLADSVSW